ncbi:MAG: hypothetical protein ACR2OC_11470 [Solirubrobacterales bacterium]
MERRKSLLRPGILASTLAFAAIGVGCGGDDEPITSVSSTTAGPTGASGASGTLESFIDQGDDICAESNAAIANIASSSATTDTSTSQEVSITEGQIDGLKSLGAPPEDAETFDRFLTAQEEVVAALEKADLAGQRGEDTTEADTEAAAAAADAQSAAEDFGFKECGQEGEAIESTGGGGGGSDAAPSAPAPTAPAAPAPTAPPVAPAPVTPAPAPPTDGGAAPPADGGTGGTSGGVSP